MERTGLKHTDADVQRLVGSAVRGDGPSFTALWDMYIDQLRQYIRSFMKKLDDQYVDDICSRSFEKAFRQIGTYDPSRSQFFTWLRVIAHNTAVDFVDSERRVHPQMVYIDSNVEDISVVDNIPDRIDTPLESIIRSEDEERTRCCIEGLPELYRDVAFKRLVEGMQYKEIAEETGLELNTVRTRIRRAKALIEKMQDDESEI